VNVQGSPEWFAERCAHATASCFADVMAVGKSGEAVTRRSYRMRIITERLTSKPTETYVNKHMERGTLLEPDARIAYELRTGNIVEQVGFIKHKTVEWCGCSLDGLIDDDGTLEIKSVLPHIQVATIYGNKMPSEHVAQVQGGLWITERQWCDFASYSPDLPGKLSLFVCRVERDDEYIEKLRVGVLAFLAEVAEQTQALLKLAA
jgi:putative phage-type endonuclease